MEGACCRSTPPVLSIASQRPRNKGSSGWTDDVFDAASVGTANALANEALILLYQPIGDRALG